MNTTGSGSNQHRRSLDASRRRARRYATAVVVVCATVVALGGGGTRAFAAPATTPNTVQPRVVESWALTPTGADPNEPGSRPDFAYTLEPGASVKDSLTVWNYSNVQLTFRVYATDAFNTAGDGFDLIPANQTPKDAGAWIHVNQSYVTLPAASKVSIGFTVLVPANAPPGDHAAGIVAASRTSGGQGGKIALDRRIGSRVYLRVSGPVTPALVVEHLATRYHASVNPLGGRLDVTYTVRNNGNVRLGAHQKVAARDVFGSVADRRPADLPDLLPGNAVTITEHFAGVAATVHVSAKVTLTPFVPAGAAQPGSPAVGPVSASASVWAFPWTILALLVVLGIVLVFVRRRPARTRRPVSAPVATPNLSRVSTGVSS